MGVTCSWIAVKGVAAGELLAALEVVESGETDHPWGLAAPMSYGVRPDGWVIIYSEDYFWSDRERVRELSRFGAAVGSQYDDKSGCGVVSSCAAEAGRDLWQVRHAWDDRTDGTSLIEVSGEPPIGWAAACAMAEAEAADDEETNWYGVLEQIPAILARPVCDYRLDQDELPFRGLKPAGETPGRLVGDSFVAPARRPNLILMYLIYCLIVALGFGLVARLLKGG